MPPVVEQPPRPKTRYRILTPFGDGLAPTESEAHDDAVSRFILSGVPARTTVDEYIAAQPAAVQPKLRELRAIIRSVVPDAEESVSYGMAAYRLRVGFVYFGAGKRHVALYGAAMGAFARELSDYDTSKGTVRFPLDQPLPEGLVRKLVETKAAVVDKPARTRRSASSK